MSLSGYGVPRRPRQRPEWIAWLAVTALMIGIAAWLTFLVNEQSKCEDKGGDYVRGAFMMECIGEDENNP